MCVRIENYYPDYNQSTELIQIILATVILVNQKSIIMDTIHSALKSNRFWINMEKHNYDNYKTENDAETENYSFFYIDHWTCYNRRMRMSLFVYRSFQCTITAIEPMSVYEGEGRRWTEMWICSNTEHQQRRHPSHIQGNWSLAIVRETHRQWDALKTRQQTANRVSYPGPWTMLQ